MVSRDKSCWAEVVAWRHLAHGQAEGRRSRSSAACSSSRDRSYWAEVVRHLAHGQAEGRRSGWSAASLAREREERRKERGVV
ncbi:unnamed protein product [Urochloa humidicola]